MKQQEKNRVLNTEPDKGTKTSLLNSFTEKIRFICKGQFTKICPFLLFSLLNFR